MPQGNLQHSVAEPLSVFKGDESVQQIGAHVFAPGQPIQIVWAFLNVGPAAWPRDAALVHAEGDRLDGPSETSVGGCQPSADVSEIPRTQRSHVAPLRARS